VLIVLEEARVTATFSEQGPVTLERPARDRLLAEMLGVRVAVRAPAAVEDLHECVRQGGGVGPAQLALRDSCDQLMCIAARRRDDGQVAGERLLDDVGGALAGRGMQQTVGRHEEGRHFAGWYAAGDPQRDPGKLLARQRDRLLG